MEDSYYFLDLGEDFSEGPFRKFGIYSHLLSHG